MTPLLTLVIEKSTLWTEECVIEETGLLQRERLKMHSEKMPLHVTQQLEQVCVSSNLATLAKRLALI